MANSNAKVAQDFAAKAGTGRPFIKRSLNVFTGTDGSRDTIYSYGYHFPMATIMPGADSSRGWWLVNSDTSSNSTSQQQGDVRQALRGTGLDMILLPFSALNEAGISRPSIRPVEILSDRYQRTEREVSEGENVAMFTSCHADSPNARMYESHNQGYVRENADGTRTRVSFTHLMGESVFEASYQAMGEPVKRACFLSGFDSQEGFGRGYFLCQLPAPAKTVAEAYALLRPAEVATAIDHGGEVTRQGDIFAIARPDFTTGELPGPSKRMAYVLGTNHVATESRTYHGRTFARGTLRHKPLQPWGTPRNPDHRAQKLGDGKTWHILAKNTVPEGRSWGARGNVD